MRQTRRFPITNHPVSISGLFGHAAFVLSGTAFLEPDILQLRVFSVAAGASMLVFAFFHPVGVSLWLPFGWNVVFMVINSAWIYRILSAEQSAKELPAAALELWHDVFQVHGLSAVDFARLLGASTWTTLRKGEVLQEEGKASNSLFLIVKGGANVTYDGEHSHALREHQFIGAMGLSAGIAVRAA